VNEPLTRDDVLEFENPDDATTQALKVMLGKELLVALRAIVQSHIRSMVPATTEVYSYTSWEDGPQHDEIPNPMLSAWLTAAADWLVKP